MRTTPSRSLYRVLYRMDDMQSAVWIIRIDQLMAIVAGRSISSTTPGGMAVSRWCVWVTWEGRWVYTAAALYRGHRYLVEIINDCVWL